MSAFIMMIIGAVSNRVRGGGLDPIMQRKLGFKISADLLNSLIFFLTVLIVPNFVLVGQDGATGVPIYELDTDLLTAICLSIWMAIGAASGMRTLKYIANPRKAYQPSGSMFDKLALWLYHKRGWKLLTAVWIGGIARGAYWGLGFSCLLFNPWPFLVGCLMPVVYWAVFNTYGRVRTVKQEGSWAVSEIVFGALLWGSIGVALL